MLSVLWRAGSRFLTPRLAARLAPDARKIDVTSPAAVLDHLPAEWDGLRVALISDLHVGRVAFAPYVRGVVELANRQKPDIVAMLGDYVVQDGAMTADVVAALAGLEAPLGKFAVLGNHDHWAGAADVAATLDRAGVTVLRNSRRIVTRCAGGANPLCLAGVDDMWEGDVDIEAALRGVSPQTPRIILCHNPDFAERLPAGLRVDLMLCGHTHGGQIRLPVLTRMLASVRNRKYREGLVRGPRCPLYVTRGLGVVGLPIRFRCPAELAILTLRSSVLM
jgi:uncharacterized protein